MPDWAAWPFPIEDTYPAYHARRHERRLLQNGPRQAQAGPRKRHHPPKTCPHGGFPIEAQVGFADGTMTTTTSAVPCPGK
jgi:hypothetical protein